MRGARDGRKLLRSVPPRSDEVVPDDHVRSIVYSAVGYYLHPEVVITIGVVIRLEEVSERQITQSAHQTKGLQDFEGWWVL